MAYDRFTQKNVASTKQLFTNVIVFNMEISFNSYKHNN